MISTFIFSPRVKTKLFFIIFFSALQGFVHAQVVGGTATANPATICSGQTSTIKLTGQIGTSIRWQRDSSGVFVFIPNQTSDTYVTPALTSIGRYRAVVSTLDLLLHDTSTVATVSIAPFSAGGTITVSDAGVCKGETVTVKLNGDQTGSTIQWQLDTAGTFVNIPGATASTYASAPLNKTTIFQAQITSEPCPSDFSNTGTVTVTPVSAGGIAKADTTVVCKGTGTTIKVSGHVGNAFQWQIDTTGTFTDISGATGTSYTTPALTRTTKYRVKVTNGTCASAFSTSVEITTVPSSVGGQASPADTTVCHGNVAIINLKNQQGSIQWQVDTTGTFKTISGATASTYTTMALTETAYFRAMVTSGSCPVAFSSVSKVTIEAKTDPGTASADATNLCSGSGTQLKLTGSSGGASIQWQSKTTGPFTDVPGATTATLNTGNLTTTTSYQALVTKHNCAAISNIVTVTVGANVDAGTIKADTTTLCSGNGTQLSISGQTAGATIQWQSKTTGAFADIAGATNATYATGNLATTTSYQAVVSLSGCSATSNTVTVTVNPGVTPGTAAAVSSTLCSGNGTDINLAGTTAGATIQWQSKTTGAFADISGATNATYTTGNLTTTTTYQAVVTLNNCSAISNAATVTVNSIPTPGTASAVTSTLCSGNGTTINLTGATAGATIQWQSKTTGAFADISGATSAAYATGNLTTTTSYQAVVTLNGCVATSNTATVTVNPGVTPGNAAATVSTLCSGNGTDITLTGFTAGAGIQWQSKTTGAFADIAGATNATYATGNLTTTTSYQAVVTLNGCSAASTIATVTVNAGVTPGNAAATASTLCSGNGTDITLTGTTAGASIQWQSKTTGAFADISGATSATYATGALTTSTSYQAVVTLTGCSAISNAITISVNPMPSAGTASAVDGTLCSGNSTTINLAGSTAGATIQWQSKTTGAFANISGANGTSYATGNLNTTTSYQAVVTLNGCVATSNTATVTVNPSLTPGTASAVSATLCSGNGTTINLTGSSGGATIQWQSKTTGAFADISGANGTSYATGNLTTTTSYQAVVTANGCTGTSNTVTVTVNTTPTAGTAAAVASTLCSGNGTTINLSGATSGTTIQWQRKTTGAFADISGANAGSYATGALNTSTSYQAVVTLNGCVAVSNTADVTVNPSPSAGSVSAVNATLCSGNGTTLNLTGTSAGVNIQWQLKTTGAFADISGATSATYATGNLTTTSSYQVVVTLNGCSATSNTATVTVNPTPAAGTASSAISTICSGSGTDVNLTGATAGATIQWQSKTTGAFADISGANNSTYATGNLTTTTSYQAVVTLNGCSVTSNAITITVNPGSNPGTTAAGSTVLCQNDSTVITLNGSTGAIQWQSKTTGSYTDIPNATAATLNTRGLTTTTSFRAVVGSNGCTSVSTVTTVTVNPKPVGGQISPSSTTTCTGTSVTLSLKNSVGTIQWQEKTSGGFSDISGETDVTYETANLTTTTTYQVILKSPGCPDAVSTQSVINVAPTSVGGTATATASSVCKGQSTTIKLTGFVGTIQWQRKTTGGFSDITNEKDSIYTTANLTVPTTYRAIVTNSNCALATSSEALVTIAPSSVGGTATADSSTLCSGTSTAIRLTGYNGTIQWQSNASGTYASIGGATGDVYTTPNLSQPTSYRAIVQSNNCPSVESTVATVQISPASVGGTISAQSKEICSGASTKLTLKGFTGNIQWQKNEGSGWSNLSGATGTEYTTPNLTVETDYRAVVTKGHCASALSDVVTISIIPALLGGEAKAVDATICSGTFTTINLKGQTGNYQWQTNASGTFTDIPGARDSALRTPNLTAATSYRAIVSGGACPSAISTEALVSTIESSKGGIATPAKSPICSGTGTTITLSKYHGSIVWQTDASGTFTDIPGANGTDYTTPNLTKTTNYRAKVTSNSCKSDFSTVATVEVDPPSIGGTVTASATAVCSGSTVTLTLKNSDGNIQWQSDESGAFTNIPQATGTVYTTFALTKETDFRAIVTKGNCPSASSNNITITIAPALSGGTATAKPPTVCKGSSTTIYLKGHTGSIQWQSNATGAFADISGATDTLYKTPNLTAETKYRAIVSSSNCASAISTEAVVTVVPASEPGTITADKNTICSGTTATLTLAGHVGSIQWQTDANGAFVDIANATSTVYKTPSLVKNTSYRAVVTSAGCASVISVPVLINITPASQGGTATAVQSSVCSGGTATINLTGEVGTEIQWQSDASGSYADISGATGKTYTTPPLTSPTHYRARVRNGTCNMSNSNVVLISITPALKGGTAKATPSTICKGTNTTITLSGNTGSQIQWQTNASGSYQDISGATDTFYLTPNLTVPTNYRARINGSGCAQVMSAVATVSVIPQSVGGTASSNPSTVCSGETSVISVTGSVGTIQWQTDETGVFTDIPGATGTSYTTPALTASTSYRAVLTSNHCASDKSNTTLVSVTPASNGGFAKASATTICNGGTTTLTLSGYTGVIQWQTDASGTFTDIPGATGISYTTPSLTKNTSYRATVTNANCASVQSNTVDITITPALNGGTATAASTTVCKGTFTTITLTQYSGSIQWQSNASGTFKDITGANNSTYTTPALTVPTTYRAIVSSGTCAPATSSEVTVSVIPSSVGGAATANVSTVCSGETAIITLKNHTGSIQWQSNASGNFVDIPGATGTTYTTPALTTATTYRAIVTSTNCSPATSTEAMVTVSPGSISGTATAKASKVCSGASTTLTLTGYTGAIQWQTDASGTFADISGATGTTYTTPALTTPTNYRALVTNGNCSPVLSNLISITITPGLSGGSAVAFPSTICKGTSTTITLSNHSGSVQWQTNASGSFMDIPGATDTFYVTPALTVPTSYQAVVSSGGCAPAVSTIANITLTPASAGGAAVATAPKVCSGENTTITLTAYTGTIQWQTDASGTYVDIFGATGNSYTTPPLTKTTAFRAIVTNGNCLPDTSTVALVDLLPASVGGIPTATASTICKGGTTTVTLTKYTGTIQWQTNASGVFTNITGATSVSYSTPILTVPTQYRAIVTSSTCSPAISSVIKIDVTDALEGGYASASPATVCDNTPTNVNLSSYKGLIQWQRDSSGIFVNIPGAVTTPYLTAPLKVNTIFRAKLSSGSCPTVYSTPVTAYVTPNLYPGTVTANPNTICGGGNTKLFIKGHSGNVQWQKDSSKIFVNLPGQTKDTCVIPVLTENTYFRARITSGSCTPVVTDSIMVSVNVVETPKGDSIQKFCSINNPTLLNLIVKDMNVDTIKWYATPLGGVALAPSTPLVDGASYYATRSAYGCESYKRLKITVTVFKSATVTSQPKNATTCPGLNAFFSVKGVGTTLTYKWMVDESGTGNNYTLITDNSTYKGSGTDTLKVFGVASFMNGFSYKCIVKGGCSAGDSTISEGAALIISANTVVNQQPSSIGMCYGNAAGFTVIASGSAISYQWQVDSTSTFVNLKNDSTYSNTTTASLKIKAFTPSMENYKYRCVITSGVCGTIVNSQEASLSFDEECNVYPVTIPNGFSPNDDGVNDKLVIEGLENYPGSVVRIFNVWGDLVYEKTDYQNDWDAKANVKNVVGEGKLPAGTYYIYVDLKKGKKGKATFLIIKY
jgi:gliding motility-associated-like protein